MPFGCDPSAKLRTGQDKREAYIVMRIAYCVLRWVEPLTTSLCELRSTLRGLV